MIRNFSQRINLIKSNFSSKYPAGINIEQLKNLKFPFGEFMNEIKSSIKKLDLANKSLDEKVDYIGVLFYTILDEAGIEVDIRDLRSILKDNLI